MTTRRTISNVATALTGVAARASGQLVLLVLTIVATRFLVPAEFGVFGLAAASVTLVRTILYTGAYEYLLKAPDETKVSTECLCVNVIGSATLSGVLFIFAAFAKSIFGTAELGWVLCLMIPSNAIAAVTAWQEALLLRGNNVRAYYLVSLSTEIFAGISALCLFELHWGIGALIAQAYIRAIFQGGAYLLIRRPAFSANPSLSVGLQVLRWSLSRYGVIFIGFLSNYGADFLLGAFLSTAASGLYRAANRIATAVSDLFAQPARTFGVTLFSRVAAEGGSPARLWPSVLTACAVFGWPALAGLAVVSRTLVPLLLGPRWAAAAPLVSIFCLLKSFTVISAVSGSLLVAFNHQRVLLVLQAVSSIATIVALGLFARYGVIAAAWSITAVSAIPTIIQLGLAISSFLGSRKPFLAVVPVILIPTAATALSALACLTFVPWPPHPEKWLLVAAVVGAGAVGWSIAALPFRRQIINSVEGLSGG